MRTFRTDRSGEDKAQLDQNSERKRRRERVDELLRQVQDRYHTSLKQQQDRSHREMAAAQRDLQGGRIASKEYDARIDAIHREQERARGELQRQQRAEIRTLRQERERDDGR